MAVAAAPEIAAAAAAPETVPAPAVAYELVRKAKEIWKDEEADRAAEAKDNARAALEEKLRSGDVGTVVATLGTTGMGAVDPLSDILDLRDRYDFRVHIDAGAVAQSPSNQVSTP